METIINNPGENKGSNSNEASSGASGVVVGAVIVVLVLIAVIVLSLPYIRERIDGMSHPGNPTINNPIINLQLPTPPIGASTTVK